MTKIEVLRAMVSSNQKNAPAWFLLGLEFTERGDRGEALLAFTQALAYGDEELKRKIVSELNKWSPSVSLRNGGRLNQEWELQTNDFHPPAAMRVIEGGKNNRNKKSGVRVAVLEKNVSFAEVGGLHDAKEAVRVNIVEPFLAAGPAKRFGSRADGGVLLYGPPGCGKTLLAKAAAGECQANFLHVLAGDMLESHAKDRELDLHALFLAAAGQKPAVLFLDELDAFGSYRKSAASAWRKEAHERLWQEMAEVVSRADRLWMMGATSRPWDLDPDFYRPGCFDHLVFVGPPDAEAREAIFRLKLAGRPSERIDCAQLAGWTELYSGADIEYVVELATEQVLHDILAKGMERPIRMSDLRESIAATRSTTIEWLRLAKHCVNDANDQGRYDGVKRFLAKHARI